MFNNISHRPTPPPTKNSHGDLRPINLITLHNLIHVIISRKQYKSNHSCIVYAKMTTYRT